MDADDLSSLAVKPLRLLLLAGLTLVGIALPAAHAESTIVILRHGEKPPQGLGQINCRGLNRSLALAPLLLSRYGTPVAIYAPNPAAKKKDRGTDYAYVRPLATIEPTAVRAGLPVVLDWGFDDIEPLAARLLAVHEGTQFVAWEHHLGERLARRLLTDLESDPAVVPPWPDDDFDSLYVIRISRTSDGKSRGEFRRESEGLNRLPETCADSPASLPPTN